MKKTKRGKKSSEKVEESKDLTQKNLEAFQDVAADVINALYYDGKNVVEEYSLLPASTETVYVSSEGILRNQLEDVAKLEITKAGVMAQYYIANQTDYDKGMILRKAGYVGSAYKEQYDGKIKSAYFPVNEMVLYWGEKPWKAKNSLKDFLLDEKADAERVDVIDDMKLKVYEMRRLSSEVRERFHSDMRIVVDFLAEGNSYRSDRKVMHKEALVRMLRALSGDVNVEDTEKILNEMNIKEEEEITMCELFEQYIRKGRQEGEEKGIQKGQMLGEASKLVDCIENAMKNLHITMEEACDALGTTVKKYEDAKSLMKIQ